MSDNGPAHAQAPTTKTILKNETPIQKKVLATVEALAPEVKRLLFIGVGCQVQALRAVERHLGLEKLYVLGTNCVDNGPREGLRKFLNAASATPGALCVWGGGLGGLLCLLSCLVAVLACACVGRRGVVPKA
jgi:hypothetical protein